MHPRPPLGARLRAAREAAGLRREHVAVAAGKSLSSIVGYESGAVTPPVAVLLQLASLYGVQPGAILDEPAEVSA